MAIDKQRLESANKVLASRILGKTLTDISLSMHGGRTILEFKPWQDTDNLDDSSEIRLTIDDAWSTSDKKDTAVLTKLPGKLKSEIDKEPKRPKYIKECAMHSSDILRLFLSLGCLTVLEAIIGEDASLRITMSEGVEIYVTGFSTEKIDTDEDSWLLEVEQETAARPIPRPREYCFAGDQDGELCGYWG